MHRRSFTVGLLLAAARRAFSHVDATGPGSDSAPAPDSAEATFGARDFERYIDAFNRDDFDAFGAYYSPHVDFRGQGGRFQGRQAVLSFYHGVKRRVRETLTIQELVVGERAILCDLLTELQVLEDWPDFPTGALHRGERRRSENFIWYDIEQRQFTRVRSAHYGDGTGTQVASGREAAAAAAPGTSSRTSLASAAQDTEAAMSEVSFRAYIDAFNRDDYAEFARFYDDDVVLVLAGKRELRGRQAIIDFYRVVKAQTRRTIQVDQVITRGNHIAAELHSEFLALEDLPHFVAGPMRRGSRIFINTFVLYDLRAGRFARIRSAEFRKIDKPALGG